MNLRRVPSYPLDEGRLIRRNKRIQLFFRVLAITLRQDKPHRLESNQVSVILSEVTVSYAILNLVGLERLELSPDSLRGSYAAITPQAQNNAHCGP